MGSIRKAPRTGRWEARYRDPGGLQRTSTFDRKSDALAFLAATETEMRRGQWHDPGAEQDPPRGLGRAVAGRRLRTCDHRREPVVRPTSRTTCSPAR